MNSRFSNLRRRLERARHMTPSLLMSEIAWRSVKLVLQLVDRIACSRRLNLFRTAKLADFLIRDTPDPDLVPSNVIRACVDEAEDALTGRFQILGFGRVDFGSPPMWHKDPLMSHRWPDAWHGTVKSAPGRGDIKIPWEASRLHWLVALARAFRYTGDDRYRAGAMRLLDDWATNNRVGFGPNWATPMEVGIRIANLVWTAELLADPKFSELASRLIRDHAWFLLRNLEFAPSLTSNHLLGNITGLCYAGAALRTTQSGRFWMRTASGLLSREILKQFAADGFNFEASTGYHRLSTELCLHSLIALERAGCEITPDARNRLRSAISALAVVTGPLNLMPAIGDDDSGLVVGLMSCRHARDAQPLIDAAEAYFDGRRGDPNSNELGMWILGGFAPRRRQAYASTALPDAQIVALSHGRMWILADCGPTGQRGNGGHAHNDTLSFVLSVDSSPIIVDPGSGSYTGDPSLRNILRSVRSHSTVSIDGEEQNRIDDSVLFSMQNDDDPRIESFRFDRSEAVLTASHNGYMRLADPVRHVRTWRLDDTGLLLTDRFECEGTHLAELVLPLAPGCVVHRSEDALVIDAGPNRLLLASLEGTPPAWTLTAQPYADQYGDTVDAPVLRNLAAVTGTTTLSLRLTIQSK